MSEYVELPSEPTIVATDGSDVRVLLSSGGGSMAHFEFPARSIGQAIRHHTVDEIWYVLTGQGVMWTDRGPHDGLPIGPGSCVAVPAGEAFQVRSDADVPLAAIAVTTPPWPGPGEAELVNGRWTPTLDVGPG